MLTGFLNLNTMKQTDGICGEKMKRVLSLQDISCFGKCSLTLAMPVISAMGVECVPVPTALLSTHTGGLGETAFLDLTDHVMPIIEHFKRLKLHFDVVSIGYLGSKKQIDLAAEIIDLFRRDGAIALLDPVMGDGGSLYKRFDMEYVREMRSLASVADYVLPNLTEAALLADMEYAGESVGEEYLERLFETIDERFPSGFIVTGVCDRSSSIGAVFHEKNPGRNVRCAAKRHGAGFHGTGDIFAAVMAGALAKGFGLDEAINLSVDFTAAVIERTLDAKTDERHGVRFEECLDLLTKSAK